MRKPRIIICLLGCLLAGSLSAQPAGLENLFFRTISPRGGFTDKGVEQITKDHLGFIWIGTRDGLYRYDGYAFKNYAYTTSDSSTLSNDGIRDLLIDKHKHLWIATEDGLNLYNRAIDAFERIVPMGISPVGLINDLETDTSGVLYIGYSGGVLKYDHSTGLSELISLPFRDIRNIQFTGEGEMLVAFVENGVGKLGTSGEMQMIIPPQPSSIRAFLLANDRLYLGYETDGLKIHSRDGGELSSLSKENGMISHDKINKIYQDSKGNIWIGTYLGLDILDISGEVYHYSHNILDPYSLPYSSIYEVYEEPGGNFWIGTWSGGLAYYHRYDNKFETARQEPGINSISNNYVSSFTVDFRGDLWIGTERGGLSVQDAQDGRYDVIPLRTGNPEPLNIKSLLTSRNGHIFIGTYKGGFYYLDQNRQSHLIAFPDIETGNEKVYALLESDTGIWAGDFTYGLFHLSSVDYTRQVHFGESKAQGGLSSSKVTSLYLDHGDLWVGTSHGLNLLPKGESSFVQFLSDKNNPTSISSNVITMITRDLDGEIWIGTRKGGLNKYQESDGTFIHYDLDDGLPGNDANGILCDESGYLWISTDNGISRFDPTDGSVNNYNVSDGLQGNQFIQGSAYISRDGRLFFGGTDGYSIIHPSQIKTNPIEPRPFLTKLILNNQEILASGQDSPLEASISETSRIRLKQDQSSISLVFSTDNHLNPSKTRYAYRMIGLDDIWQYSFINRVNYSNMKAGTYLFELRAANNDGVWSKNSLTLEIHIQPPWWAHPLTIILYVLVGLVTMFLIRNMILYRERMSSAIKLESVKRESEENIHKLKLQFFTNISHEFKTPLTLILSPIQRLVQEHNLDQDVKEDLMLAEKNAMRLKRLVNQFIEFRKIDQVKLKLHLSKVDLVKLCEEIYSCFTELAEKRRIDYSFNQQIEPVDIWLDIEKMENAIFNVLSNAFKYTGDGGQIQFSIRKGLSQVPRSWEKHQIGESSDELFVEISDTGTGIHAEELGKIFERFHRSDKTNIHSGSGIGLSLAKEYTLLHQGSLSVASSPGEGSTFTFGLRLGRAHFENQDNMEFTSEQKISIKTRGSDLPDELTTISDYVPDSSEQKLSILLIEDNLELNQYLTRVLSTKYKVVHSLNGEEGLALASRLLPELILTDIMLPGLDGLQLCKRVKTDPLTSHIPVVLFTALSEDSHRIEGIETGADAYLTKPVDIQLLRSTIHNLIEARKKLRLAYGGMGAASDREEGLSAFDANLIRRAKMYIDSNITNPDISTTKLASELNMSRTNLHRKLKSLTGKSSTEFIRNLRINKAMELMEQDGISIAEVCYAVGFTSTSYFSKCFKEIYGIKPSEYKRNMGNLQGRFKDR